jgi:hypothetical protein
MAHIETAKTVLPDCSQLLTKAVLPDYSKVLAKSRPTFCNLETFEIGSAASLTMQLTRDLTSKLLRQAAVHESPQFLTWLSCATQST